MDSSHFFSLLLLLLLLLLLSDSLLLCYFALPTLFMHFSFDCRCRCCCWLLIVVSAAMCVFVGVCVFTTLKSFLCKVLGTCERANMPKNMLHKNRSSAKF